MISRPLKNDLSFGRTVLSGNHVEEGGLSCAVGSDDGLKGVGKNLEVDVIDGHMAAETDGEVFRFDDWFLIHLSCRLGDYK